MSNAVITSKEFKRGMVAVAVIYAGLFGFIAIKGKDISKRIEEGLATQTVSLERLAPPAPQETATAPVPAEMLGPAQPYDAAHDTAPEMSQVTGDALYPAPMEGLYYDTPQGKLPKISEKGLTPFQAYKKPFVSPGKPLVAVAVLDYGLSEAASEMAVQLPPHVSLVLSPYAADPERWQQQAREHGHEVWLQMPLETKEYPMVDPGPQGILASGSLKYNQDRLEWLLTRTPGYAGIAAFHDNAFSGYEPMLTGLMKGVFSRGLGYLELNPAAPPEVETMAYGSKAPYARGSIVAEDISLKTLEKIAIEKGYVVATMKLQPGLLQAMSTWLETLASKDMAIAPVSALTDRSSVPAPAAPVEAAPADAPEPTPVDAVPPSAPHE
jgi:polysaccharide deacetylase 2 family uncharacterized protein YibQ